jgi:hypothetical protein
VVSNVEGYIHGLMPDTNPYLTGLGLVLGVSTFGTEGILIGPMLIILVKIFFQLFAAHLTSSGNKEDEKKEKVEWTPRAYNKYIIKNCADQLCKNLKENMMSNNKII